MTRRCSPTRQQRTVRAVAGARLAGLLLLASWIGAADATAFDAFFNGPSNYGISEADAIAARDSAGVPWVSPPAFGTADGYYAIESSGVLSFAPVPPVGTDNTSLESWTVENVSGEPLEGVSYLLFSGTVPFEKNGEFIEFDPENVGITIDDVSWVIIPTNQSGTDYYYPAVVLDGLELDGAVSDAFDVNYVVTEPLPQAPAGSGLYQLPRLAVARAFLPAAESLPEVDPGGNSAPAGNTSYAYDPQGRLNTNGSGYTRTLSATKNLCVARHPCPPRPPSPRATDSGWHGSTP